MLSHEQSTRLVKKTVVQLLHRQSGKLFQTLLLNCDMYYHTTVTKAHSQVLYF